MLGPGPSVCLVAPKHNKKAPRWSQVRGGWREERQGRYREEPLARAPSPRARAALCRARVDPSGAVGSWWVAGPQVVAMCLGPQWAGTGARITQVSAEAAAAVMYLKG